MLTVDHKNRYSTMAAQMVGVEEVVVAAGGELVMVMMVVAPENHLLHIVDGAL